MSFQDKTLQCSDCEASFTFSVEEQEQFQARGYTNEPGRCPACRAARKARIGNTGNTGNTGFTSNSYGSSPQRQLFPAVCSDCGKATQVPFEPRQGRPVYCSDCYRKVRASK